MNVDPLKKNPVPELLPSVATRREVFPQADSTGINNVALYIRVGHSLRNRISQGEWPPLSQLPTIGDLAKQYGVALVTVRQALNLLASDGLVSSTRGRGTFVNAKVKSVAQNPGLRAAINDRLALPENCSIEVLSRATGTKLPSHFIPEGATQFPEYVFIEKIHLQDGEPFSYMTLMVAKQLYDRFPPRADEHSKILKLILDQGPLKLLRSRLEIVLTYADDKIAALLKCAPLSALVRIRTSRVDMAGNVVLCHDSLYRGDRFIYEVEEEGVELGESSGLAVPATLPSSSQE
jgi:GntR family transcriptional regulator